MKSRYLCAAFLMGGLALGVSALTRLPSANAQSAAMQVNAFQPGLDDLMTMLVQPRHIKLYYAGRAENWTLAAFQLKELRSALRRIGRTIPNYHGADMDQSVATIFALHMEEMDTAIPAHDADAFSAVYGELTTACNTCHQSMDHPFLVTKTPEASAALQFADQDFSPQAE